VAKECRKVCPDDVFHGAPQYRLVQVVASALAGGVIDVDPRCREDPLPAPLAAGVRILPGQCVRQLDPAGAPSEVVVVAASRPLQMA